MADVVGDVTVIDHKIVRYTSKPEEASEGFRHTAVVMLLDH